LFSFDFIKTLKINEKRKFYMFNGLLFYDLDDVCNGKDTVFRPVSKSVEGTKKNG
jgi:hypothetical protein